MRRIKPPHPHAPPPLTPASGPGPTEHARSPGAVFEDRLRDVVETASEMLKVGFDNHDSYYDAKRDSDVGRALQHLAIKSQTSAVYVRVEWNPRTRTISRVAPIPLAPTRIGPRNRS